MNVRPFRPDESKAIEELFTSVFSASEGEAGGQLIGSLASELLKTTPPDDLLVFVALEAHAIIAAMFLTRVPTDEEPDLSQMGIRAQPAGMKRRQAESPSSGEATTPSS